ncbi:MAG: flavodoxin domain-containing protein [Candidatus Krumholzibacteriota bacterium]|nr:flavodoxin domain-containing protein [Candidatus Krumholzibacteriota bacterium]
MRTLIVYMTAHGCAEKAARLLAGELGAETVIADLKRGKAVDPDGYDAVVVGSSIHAGKVQKGIRKYCERHREALLGVRLGLFVCHMQEGEEARSQFEAAYPEGLRRHASAAGLFGGEFDFSKMNFLQRGIVRKIAKIEKSVSRFDEAAVRDFAATMKAGGG